MSGQQTRKLENMLCLDVFLMSLNPDSAKSSKFKDREPQRRHHQLLCRDADSFLHPNDREYCDYKTSYTRRFLRAFQNKYQWESDIDTILAKNRYEAVVLTDQQQIIRWVDLGFTKMTGYDMNYAVGRYPKFLQGANTCPATRQKIREGLDALEPFKASIVNQRKNGEDYRCELNIFPLFNKQGQTTHFLALENELR